MCLPYVSEMSPVSPPNLPYIDEIRAADKPLRLTPAFNVLFLRRSMYFFLHTHVRLIASSTDANQTHQCSHRQRHTPRQQRDLTQTANISSLVDTRAHSRPHLHWTRGNVE